MNNHGEILEKPWVEKYRPNTLDDIVGIYKLMFKNRK